MGRDLAETEPLGPGDEELVRAHLTIHPRATQKDLRELLLRERGVEVNENAFGEWARRKRLTTAYHGLSGFTPAQVERAIRDASSPLNEAERAYLAARKGIGTEPVDQKEAARRAGLPSNPDARRFERIALERLGGYFEEDAVQGRRRKRPARGPAVRGEGPPLGVSSTEVAKALERARAVGMRLTERQEAVARALWGVEGAAQLAPVEIAREIGVHRHTVRDTGLRALAALRRAGHLPDSAAPRTERRSRAQPTAWAGLLDEDRAALAEAVLCEDGPWSAAAGSLPGAEVLRGIYGMHRPAHAPRPLVRDVAAELGFVSEARFKRAYSRAIENLLSVVGLEDAGPEEVSSRVKEKAAERLRRSWPKEADLAADDLLPPGSKRSPNLLAGLSRGAVGFVFASPRGVLSRRERYALGLRGGLESSGTGSSCAAPTQGEVAERLGVRKEFMGRFERRATWKLKELLEGATRGRSGPKIAGLSDGARADGGDS